MTAASKVDLKGLARPEHFDGSDEKCLDRKYGFKNVMSLLEITPYLEAVENSNRSIDLSQCTDREKYLGKLLHTILDTWLLAGRAKSVFRLVAESNGWEAWRRVAVEYESREGALYAAMFLGVMKPKWSGSLPRDWSSDAGRGTMCAERAGEVRGVRSVLTQESETVEMHQGWDG
eukprot:16450789-Heterocapsa_arctica.AAC.1